MARFDVYAFADGTPLVVDVQADLLSGLGSRVVIPLVLAGSASKEVMPKLTPLLHVSGTDYRLITTDIVGIPSSLLGERVANIEEQRQVIIDAIDFLMQGF